MDHAHEDHIREVNEQVVVDRVNRDNTILRKVTQFIWLFFGILEGLILLRVLLKLLASNPQNPFAAFVYSTTQIFLWPFFGLTGTPSAAGAVLEIPSLIAMLVFAILGWSSVTLLWILFYRRPTKTRHVHERVDRIDLE